MSVSLYGSGQTILQVVQGSLVSTQLSVANAAPLATTGISATITPQSTTSKILVIPNITNIYSSAAGGIGLAIYRGGSQIYLHGYGQAGGYLGSKYAGATDSLGAVSFPYLDSPATTSSTTYTMYWGSYGSTSYINYQSGSTVVGSGSYIILMEISGS